MRLNIGPGAKASFASAADHNYTDAGITIELIKRQQRLASQGRIDRIDLPRAIERDPAHPVYALDQNGAAS